MPPLAGCSPLRGSAPVGLPQIANPKRLAQGETTAVVGWRVGDVASWSSLARYRSYAFVVEAADKTSTKIIRMASLPAFAADCDDLDESE